MWRSKLRWLIATTAVVALMPSAGFAQESTVSGTATDSTGGVLPGVTVTALNEASGNTFVAVTDERGSFRLAVRTGVYRISVQLPGFTTPDRNVELLLGQTAVVNVQMSPSRVQETVTVSAESPLVDTTTSTVASNIDPRQMQELPINGRNWMDLTLLAPGARRNEGGGLVENRQGYAQTNIDGQQVTVNYHSSPDSEQPGYSRDAIAEFQVIANRFDASQGRSAGMLVNAISKSGTNTFAGTFGTYFRSDIFNAKDFIEDRVLPYSNQQAVGTFGGPVVRNRVHFFGSYEYEREPKTFTYNSPYPSFNVEQHFPNHVHKVLGRLDYQFTPQTRLSVRGSGYDTLFYNAGGNTSTVHPSAGGTRGRVATQYFGTLTHVLSNRTVNEIKTGATDYERQDQPATRWKGGDFPYDPVLHGGAVIVLLRGYTIGASPINILQDTQTVRDDFTTSFDWGGRHDVKLGGDYMRFHNEFRWCLRCMGEIDARGGPPPANLESLFPVWNDASTWNLAPLSPITRWVYHSLSDTEHRYDVVRHLFAGWAQDDWKVHDNLTLNLGVRYDFDNNGNSEKLRFLPWLPGYGLFYAFAPNDGVQQTVGYQHRFENQIFNDGRPDFVPNWFGPGPSPDGQWGGPKPTFEQSLQRACDVNFVPGCVYRALNQEINYPGRETSYSHQASAGVQRQFGNTMSFEANYVYSGGRLEEPYNTMNVNLTYNPATGANYPFTDVTHRAFPQWGLVNFELLEGRSNYHAGDFTFTKRFSNRWQASATYTLAFFQDANPTRDQWFIGDDGVVARRPIGFALAPDLGGEYGPAGAYVGGGAQGGGDQRHRAVINGIWDLGYGVQLSGIYFYGSGERRTTDTGVDFRDEGGGAVGRPRLRADGTILPRNNVVGDPIHRVDLRLQKRIRLGGHASIDGIFEVFNLVNHANYGSYVTNESSPLFGRPSFSDSLAYQPRMLQLGFRTTF